MNKDKSNLKGILESIDKILKYTTQLADASELFSNELVYDAVLMNFVNIGELSARLSENLKLSNSHINWIKIKGLRNIIAHDYFGVDADEIWEIIQKDLVVLKIQIQDIIV